MRLRAISSTPATTDVDVLAVPIYRDESDLDGDLAELDQASGGAIQAAIDWGEFNPRRARLRARRRGHAPGRTAAPPQRRSAGPWRVARSPAGGGRDAAVERARCADPRPLAPRRRRPPMSGARPRRARWPERIGRPRSTVAFATPRRWRDRRGGPGHRRRPGRARRRPGRRRGDGLRPRPREPRGERSDPGADGRDRPRAGGRRLHGRGAGARPRWSDWAWAACSAWARAAATRRGSSPSSCRAGKTAANGDWRSSGRASASTPAASASSQATGWGT